MSAKDCEVKCRSKAHAQQLVIAASKGTTEQAQLFVSRCHNGGTIRDELGRTVLHIAASCGKWELAEWLIQELKADVQAQDSESGWTALHRALFYGHLNTARRLIALSASFSSLDREGLSPLDIILKDRPPYVSIKQTGLQEVYTWGDNNNFTLGHDTTQHRNQPEPIDIFRRDNVSISQVVMCKLHSVFLTSCGKVYTCGHGRHGRLAHKDVLTCLEPKRVESLKDEVITAIAAARDHTLFLTESGAVYSCGSNEYHQLGQTPPPTSCVMLPKLIGSKAVKGKSFIGICAQRFHSVAYTANAVYTFGLNAGQLGHPKPNSSQESRVSAPRVVSVFNYPDVKIQKVVASDAATVVLTKKGDVTVLTDYTYKRIVSNRLDLVELSVCGGHLDHQPDPNTNLSETGGSPLIIAMLDTAGNVFLWRERDPVLKRCSWASARRALQVTQISLNLTSLLLVTADGEAFTAPLPVGDAQKTEPPLKPPGPQDSFHVTLADRIERDDVIVLRLVRVPGIHRAVAATSDKKGHNMAVIQCHPRASLTEVTSVRESEMQQHMKQLLDEADLTDVIHDAVLEVGSNSRVPVHRYILASRSEYFRQLFTANSEKKDPEEEEDHDLGHPTIKIDADPEIFTQLLTYIYTDTCSYLTIGAKIEQLHDRTSNNTPPKTSEPNNAYEPQDINITAYAYNKKKKEQEKKKEQKPSKKNTEGPKNPLKKLQELAKHFGVKQLVKKLDNVKLQDGYVQMVSGRSRPRSTPPRFDPSKHVKLSDVSIKSSVDGSTVAAHKCILVARLEYFHSMLASGWIETSMSESLSLPIPEDIFQVVLYFLYFDDVSILTGCEDVEFVCNVLVVADQLLILRLKEMCEEILAQLMNLKSCCELLEFACVYNAEQLKTVCQQYIVVNLATLLETRALDVLSDDVIEELSEYYRGAVQGMCRRRITPYEGFPDHAFLEGLSQGLSQGAAGDPGASGGASGGSRKPRKKKRSRTKSAGEGSGGEVDAKSDGVGDGGNGGTRLLSVCSEMSDLAIEEEEGDEEGERRKQSKQQVSPVSQDSSNSLMSPTSLKSPPQTSLTSPTSPTSPESSKPLIAPSWPQGTTLGSGVHGLRAIMAEQAEQKRQQQKSLTKTSSQPQTPQPPSYPKPTKLSQKERKKLQKTEKSQAESKAEKIEEMLIAQSPPTNPWGQAKPNMVASFKDLMIKEEQSHSKTPVKPVVAAATPKPTVVTPRARSTSGSAGEQSFSWGLPVRIIQRPQSSTSTDATSPLSPLSPPTPSNPWKTLPSPTPLASSPTNSSFSAIVSDQRQQNETLVRTTKKPLALIQLEEKAILELRQHYAADTTCDYTVTVERVPASIAAPTWEAATKKS